MLSLNKAYLPTPLPLVSPVSLFAGSLHIELVATLGAAKRPFDDSPVEPATIGIGAADADEPQMAS